MRPVATAAVLAALIVSSGAARAEANTVFVLDASNSMWGQVGGVAKIEVARTAMAGLLDLTPAGMKLGLMAYGHRTEGDCADIELLTPLGDAGGAALRDRIAGLKPKGKTPIGAALEQAGGLFPTPDAYNTVVLLSDGIETCAADPCAVSAALAAKGVNTRVHVVGFDVDAAAREQLRCIAERGNGIYRDAADAGTLAAAFAQVAADLDTAAKSAQAPAPAPAEPEWVEVFRDDFEGADLAESWQVANPDPDGFIVEGGELLIIGKHVGGAGSKTLPNRFTLPTEMLPEGDWQIEISFDAEFSTAAELVGVGVFTSETDFIVAEARYLANVSCWVDVRALKAASSGPSEQVARAWDWRSCNDKFAELGAFKHRPHHLRLTKNGRNYRASMRFGDLKNDDGTEKWTETGGVSSLRPPKSVVLYGAQQPVGSGGVKGETLYKIQSIVIRAPAKKA